MMRSPLFPRAPSRIQPRFSDCVQSYKAIARSRDIQILAAFSFGTFAVGALQQNMVEQQSEFARVIELNVGELFAIAAIAKCMVSLYAGGEKLGRTDIVVLLLSALPWLALEQHVVFVGFTIAGLAIWLRQGRPMLASLGQVWLAASVYELWGKALFKLLSRWVIGLEVDLIAFVGRLFVPDLKVDGIKLEAGHRGWSIYILEGCSSFHNISLAFLIWLSLLKIGDAVMDRHTIRALAESIMLVVALNVARIILMIPSKEAYTFWHEGLGASLMACSTVVASALPVVCRMKLEHRSMSPQASY